MATWCLGQPEWQTRRTVFSQGFLKDLASVWASHGHTAMEKTAIDQTAVFFAACARLIGPEVKLTIEQNYAGLSPNELMLLKEVMAAINEGLPNAWCSRRRAGGRAERKLSPRRQDKGSYRAEKAYSGVAAARLRGRHRPGHVGQRLVAIPSLACPDTLITHLSNSLYPVNYANGCVQHNFP